MKLTKKILFLITFPFVFVYMNKIQLIPTFWLFTKNTFLIIKNQVILWMKKSTVKKTLKKE